MTDINKLELKGFCTNSIRSVFHTMLSMEVSVAETDPSMELSGSKVVGCVGFAGDVVGNICVHVPKQFARVMTAAMLGMEVDEVEDDEEINDVIGEVSNMVGGDMKSKLCDAGFPCVLSIPNVTSGSDFKIESKGWMRHEKIAFQHQEQLSMIEVFIKSVV
ncbi:MAG: chemotaxis protein CheX [Deltaproteobacteria bacterium]|nr:chemotaxis protein CheX [Deltaproteobacteria bacterium]